MTGPNIDPNFPDISVRDKNLSLLLIPLSLDLIACARVISFGKSN